jgi:hypothetical protein
LVFQPGILFPGWQNRAQFVSSSGNKILIVSSTEAGTLTCTREGFDLGTLSMCYVVYLSTVSEEDLSAHNHGLFMLSRVEDRDEEPAISLLRYPNRWYLESKYGSCSCHFRHWMEGNGDEFGPTVDWFPEDPEDVESTAAFYDIVARLVRAGDEVDVVDAWNGTPTEDIRTIDVSLARVDRDSFRFFENARFQLMP